MNKNNLNNSLELLSISLIMSYYLFNNIIIVFAGIFISLYLINKDNISRILGYNDKKSLKEEKENAELNEKVKAFRTNTNQSNTLQEDCKLSLVETIEELGFIPSIDKTNDNNVA